MNFPLKYHLYDQYATVQHQVAENLMAFTRDHLRRQPHKIFEVGCGTGIFTRLLRHHYPQSFIKANDLFDTAAYLPLDRSLSFQQGDIQKLPLDKYDLIASSSVFQWIDDLEELLDKLGKSSDEICFAMYLQGNLKEIKEHFGNSLNYRSLEDVEAILSKYFHRVKARGETLRLNFDSPREALRHLKNTGVTGAEFSAPSLKKLRQFASASLTYEVGYFYAGGRK